MRRRSIVRLIFGVLVIVCGLALWYADAVWLPTRGKAWLTQRLAERLHAHVTLQTLGLHPLRGVVFKNLRITDPATPRNLHITSGRVLIAPWTLLRRTLVFRSHLLLADPAAMELTVSGRYGWSDQRWTTDIETKPFTIQQLESLLTQRLPPALRAGTAMLHVQATQDQPQHVQLVGRCEITDLLVEQTPYRARGAVHIEGTARRDAATMKNGVARWHWQLAVTPRGMTVEGLPRLPAITQIAGTAQLNDIDLAALHLTGTAGEAAVQVTGHIVNVRQPQANLTITVETPARFARSVAPHWPEDLQLDGAVRLVADVRGALSPLTAVQWQATGSLTNGTLTTARVSFPIEQLTARVRCDSTARRCTIEQCAGRAGQATVTLTGIVDLTDPFPATATVHLNTPLQQLAPWMPTPLRQLAWGGDAAVTAEVHGALLDPTPEILRADAEIHHGSVQPASPWPAIQQMAGHLAYDEEQLSTSDLRFTINETSYTITGTMQHLHPEDEPEVTLRLASTQLAANLDAHVEDHNLHVRLLEGRYRGSTFRVLGDLLNWPHPTANLYAESVLDLADVSLLPLPPSWRQMLATQEISGTASVTASYQGPLDAQWMTGRLGVKVTSPRCTVGKITVEQLVSDARVDEGRLTIPAAQAQYAGGTALVRLTADLQQPQPPFRLQFDATHIDLDQAMRSWITATPQPIAGALSTSWIIEGQGMHPAAWRGDGTVQAAGENLSTVPMFDRVLGGLGGVVADYLRLGQLRQVTFKQADGHFTIGDGQAVTRDLTFRSDTMGVVLDGHIGLDGGLDLIASPSVTLAVLQQSPLAEQMIAKPARQLDLLALGRVRISGTLQEPQFKSQLVPLRELLKQFLGERVQDVLREIGNMLRR